MDTEKDLESLGEKLYDLIYPKHSDMTPKLTGMLLELPGSVIDQMLQDEALLTKALDRALAALQPDNSKLASETDDADSVSLDSLGEQLYDLIDLYNTGHTQKITGMLLEQKRESVRHLLSDPALLEERVKMALETLQDRRGQEETDMSDSFDKEDLEAMGERLFVLVQDMEPTNCADITGMLLEMDSRTLQQILCDRTMLEVAVHRAKNALDGAHALSQTQPETQ
ncbi:polyadenylate-binding protein 5 isoform X2 [Electrophorus electricus]|uniref:PABC domain-containing protein n=1 Tax=Electrophorus electricus TaxID=8005 RepID=A0A4W4E943_ELEEL|nr:polyadenylate-binding protein 5 isoform X2 [Electrophorus electricus]